MEEVASEQRLEPSRVEYCAKRGEIIPPEMSVVPVPFGPESCRAGTVTSTPSSAGSAPLTLRRNAKGSGRCSITSQSMARRILPRCSVGKSAKSVRSSTIPRRWSRTETAASSQPTQSVPRPRRCSTTIPRPQPISSRGHPSMPDRLRDRAIIAFRATFQKYRSIPSDRPPIQSQLP